MSTRPDPPPSILNLFHRTAEGRGPTPLLHSGPGPDVTINNLPDYYDPVRSWAEETRRRQAADSRRAFLRGACASAAATAATAAGAVAWFRNRLDFGTDFSEPNAVALWRSFESARLAIEPYDGRSSAVPSGGHLLMPSATMADSQAFVLAAVHGRPAEFMLRANSPRDCYRLRIGKYGRKLTAAVFKRRAERESRVWPNERNGRIYLDYLSSMATVEVAMDGPSFSVWLRDRPRPPLAGMPRFEGSRRTLLAHWEDGEFRDGLVGIWGPHARSARPADDYRVFSVGLRA
ncbi:MAG: hypothetical protein R2729_27145 [Bryobacteraceae bacterium]